VGRTNVNYKALILNSKPIVISKRFLILERMTFYFIETQCSPINPHHLKLISIHDCRQCVIMSTVDRGNLDTYLVDKSSVLCALTIRQIQLKRADLLSDLSLTRKSKTHLDMTGSKFIRHNRIQTLTTLSKSRFRSFTNSFWHISF
jgi:hypothetical protein